MRRLLLIALPAVFLCMSFTPVVLMVEGDISKKDDKKLKQADELFAENKHLLALPIYEQLAKGYPDDTYFRYRLGVCYLYRTDQHEKALELLEAVEKEEPQFVEVKFYVARAYHLLYQFNKAIDKFKDYKRKAKPIGSDKDVLELYLTYCENAILLTEMELAVTITNAGPPISTKFSEYVPLITPDESMMLTTYRGKGCMGDRMDPITGKADPTGEYFEDIHSSVRTNEEWSKPKSMPDNINTKGHDAAIALSVDGQMMFVYKSSKKIKEDIYLSKYDGEDWERPKPLQGEVNTDSWEGSCCLAGDGMTLYFASDRPGGLGGRDLYTAELQEDGTWSNIRNLGSPINTKFNEDAPFIHPDNITLYFSSDGAESMGGYDIFYSQIEDNKWGLPINMGFPINTTDDDRYYVVSANGERGYMSSARTGGLGRHDVYIVSPGNVNIDPVLALVIGEIKLDNSPTEAVIKVTDTQTDKLTNVYRVNAQTGKYTLAVIPGNKYKLAIEVEDQEPYIEYLNVESLDTYVDIKHDFELFSKEYRELIKVDDKAIATLQQQLDAELERQRLAENRKMHENEKPYHEYKEPEKEPKTWSLADTVEVKGISFKIEIGAYENPEDFKLQHLSKYGEIKSKTYPDGITRFTIDPFKTLKEAEEFREMLVQKEPDAKDAFVMVLVLDERKTVEEFKAEYDTIVADIIKDDATQAKVDKFPPKDTIQAAPIVFKNILFDFDKSFLRNLSEQELEKLYAYLQQHPEITVQMDGHTDWIGTDGYNDSLGERRARRALDYLISKGISTDRIEWRTFGETRPVAKNDNTDGSDNPDGRQLNRRCEFMIGQQAESYIIMKF